MNISEVDVSTDRMSYVCYGLGSCIGLFVMDRSIGIVGGAHIPLADDHLPGSLLSAKTMIDSMLRTFKIYGSDLKALRAKLTGGSLVFDTSLDIGARNAEAVIQILINNRVFIAATDVGGRISRTATFNGETGDLLVSTSEKRNYII